MPAAHVADSMLRIHPGTGQHRGRSVTAGDQHTASEPAEQLADSLLRFHPGTGQRAALAAAGHFPIDADVAQGVRRQLTARAAAPESEQVISLRATCHAAALQWAGTLCLCVYMPLQPLNTHSLSSCLPGTLMQGKHVHHAPCMSSLHVCSCVMSSTAAGCRAGIPAAPCLA